jgi:vacuolar-type H+-ATPase subunit H
MRPKGGFYMAIDAFERIRAAESQADETVSRARQEAARILEDAEKSADLLVEKAEREAEKDAGLRLESAEAESARLFDEDWAKALKEVEALSNEASLKMGRAVARIMSAFA